jgi:hypothetical protein
MSNYNHDGTGLRFEGMPIDLKKFYWILAEEGCHPKAADRIIGRIKENGYDLLTVMNRLNFKWIEEQLLEIGVKMTFIEPLEGWYNKYDDGRWPEESLPLRFRKK